jgi:hypothetical protein
VTYTRCCIDAINSPDDGHMAARNMQRIEINIHEKELCVKLVIYKDWFHNFISVFYDIKFRGFHHCTEQILRRATELKFTGKRCVE